MKWSSDEMYNGNLIADASVADHLLEIPEESKNEDMTEFLKTSMFLLDTTGSQMYENLETKKDEIYNIGEASIVKYLINTLLEH
jgi:ATP-dependent RNA/DNA helicase IGHMBP2